MDQVRDCPGVGPEVQVASGVIDPFGPVARVVVGDDEEVGVVGVVQQGAVQCPDLSDGVGLLSCKEELPILWIWSAVEAPSR